MWNSFRSIALSCLCVSTLFMVDAYADAPADAPLLDEVHTVAAANSVVPAEHTFTVSVAGTYQLTLTDFGAAATPNPVPMAALKLAITSGGTLVGTPLMAAGTMQFSATPGVYVIHVVGTLGDSGSGQIDIQIRDSTNTTAFDFSDSLGLPADAIPNSGSGIDDSFTVPTSGNFQVTLNDLQLPQALNTLTLAIVQLGGGLITTLPAAGSTTVALQSGVTYGIFAVGSVNPPTLNAGLFGASVTPVGMTTPVYAKTVPVGSVTLLESPMLAAANYSLQASDLQFPSALSQIGAVVALNGHSVATLTASGTQPFTAIAGTYQVFAVGVAPAAGMGSYSVAVQSSQGTALSVARAVVDTASTGHAYSFDTTVASGQTYAFDLADFGYPAPFVSLNAAVVQGGTLVTGSQLSIGTSVANTPATGTTNIVPAAGPLSLLVFAQPAASASTTTASAGLFGIDLTTRGAADPAFETTQGVGQLFAVRKLSILAAGSYQVTVGDVGFPAVFQNLAAIVTRGTSRVGSIYGGGSFGFPAVVGNYFVNFVAQPTGTDQAGTYSMVVKTAPTPTLTFTSTPTSVASGGTVTLNWKGVNVTSCSASNGWTGSKDVSGNFTSGALTATTTFALSCEGPGGNVASSVTVNVDPPPPAKSGGGGALRPEVLLVLFGLILLRRRIFPC